MPPTPDVPLQNNYLNQSSNHLYIRAPLKYVHTKEIIGINHVRT